MPDKTPPPPPDLTASRWTRRSWRRLGIWTGISVGTLLVGAFLFAWAGIYNVSSSSGHFPWTRWFLNFTMASSVRTHALMVETPPLDDPAMVARGAGHYATGCEPCHGGPGREREETLIHMTPPPPRLETHVTEWEPRELFWIVQHGIKYTAMPAWPTQKREDEAWDMIAFLLRLPELSEQEYETLTRGAPSEEEATGLDAFPGRADRDMENALAECARCHGWSGAGRVPGAFPRLDGQKETYLYESLKAYARGGRNSGFMQPVAARLNDEALRALAAYYARRNPAASTVEYPAPDAELVRRGAAIASEGIPQADVPSCNTCHGPTAAASNPHYPTLAGQPAAYLARQLELFQTGARGGTAFAPIMQAIAERLSAGQIEAAAAYFASRSRAAPTSLSEATGR